jgi:tetratricopeptide (TPR) repeat protein/transcriptional regulator with XRE-family HTH domain
MPGTAGSEFGDLLRRLRNDSGLTQEDLADKAGLSPRSVSDLERGVNRTARRATARLLAVALGLQGAARAEFEAVASGRAPSAPAGQATALATRTLPRDITSFTGREAELAKLIGVLSEAATQPRVVSIQTIGGMAGVGKTALAVHAAHLVASSFPDGQYFLPLHGHTPGQLPVEPMDALASLLLTAGVPPSQIPGTLEARTARWRDHVADKRLLLVLDDAVGHDQVRPLLPGSGNSIALITSRRHLTALDDAVTIGLDVLPADQAAGLLTRLSGRPDLGPDDVAVAEVVRLCGYLPLAVGMLARQLYHHPSWTVADLAADLGQVRDRLELMRAENLSVAAAFDLSYADLTPDQQVLFRRLGLHPGFETDAYAAAALMAEDLPQARRQLQELYEHYLLSEPSRGRYRLHDLLGQHARALADTDPPADREQAVAQLLGYYQHVAELADRQLNRPRHAAASPAPAPEAVPVLADRDRAQAWLAAERENLLACIDEAVRNQLDGRVIGLTSAVAGYLRDDGRWTYAVTRHASAVAAAQRLGDLPAEAAATADLGVIRRLTGDYPDAAEAFRRSLGTYRDLGDRLGEADVLYQLGTMQRLTGDYAEATKGLEASLEIFHALGSQAGEADALTELGSIRHLVGDYPGATESLRRALGIYTELADRRGQARALYHLGAQLQVAGSYTEATATLDEALSISRELGDRLGQARTLHMRGALRYSMGEYASATADLEQALIRYAELSQRSGQANALCTLGIVRHLTGDYPRAAEALEESLRLSRSIGYRLGEANAHCILGMVETATQEYVSAAASFGEALSIYRGIGDRLGEANVLNEFGDLHRRTGDYPAAAGVLDQSISIYRELGQPAGEAEALNHLGALWLARGDPGQARQSYQQVLDLLPVTPDVTDRARALEGIGRCDIADGLAGDGEAALRQALEMYQRIGAAEAARLAEELAALP